MSGEDWKPLVPRTLRSSELINLSKKCQAFIIDQKIRCAEDVAQSDRVIRNAYELIEAICEIVGYYRDPDDVEEDDG